MKIKLIKVGVAGLLISLMSLMMWEQAEKLWAADDTTPEFIIYEGRLLDSEGKAIKTKQVMRFSLWKDVDWVSGDENGDGTINEGASNYAGWWEEHTVKPNARGVFSVKLGKDVDLPEINYGEQKFLQIEIRPEGTGISEYRLMDSQGVNGVDEVDRQGIGSMPYAKNTERLDNRKIGADEGDLALLDPEGRWKKSQIPGGTEVDEFVIDSDDSAGTGERRLMFGSSLGAYLAYNPVEEYFYFSKTLRIDGNLELFDAGSGNKVVIGTGSLTATRGFSFPDEGGVLVTEEGVQTLRNKTIDADENTILNLDWGDLEARDGRIVLLPEYANAVLREDGSDNMATLRMGEDGATGQQYYVLTSQEPGMQDLDLTVKVPIPHDFVAWKGVPVEVWVMTEEGGSTNAQVDIEVRGTDNGSVILTGGDDLASDSAGVWIKKGIGFGSGIVTERGSSITLNMKLQSRDGKAVYLGAVMLNYESK